MVMAALHFEYEHRLLRGDTSFDRFFGDRADNAHSCACRYLRHISRHSAKHTVMMESGVMSCHVFVARPLRSCLFAASNNFAEASNSSAGIWDTPGRENTSCTSRKAAARRFDVIGVRSRCCALPSSLVGLLLPGPIIHLRGQIIRVIP
jgi:hypothetical protein